MVTIVGLPKITTSVLRSVRAFVEFGMFLCQRKHSIPQGQNLDYQYIPLAEPQDFSTEASTTFKLMEQQLDEYKFYRHSAFYIVVLTWELPRQHSFVHTPSGILLAGAAYGKSSNTPETLHKTQMKDPYRHSKKKAPLSRCYLQFNEPANAKCGNPWQLDMGNPLLPSWLRNHINCGGSVLQVKKTQSSHHQQLISEWEDNQRTFPATLMGKPGELVLLPLRLKDAV